MQIPYVSQMQASHFPLTTGKMESSAEIIVFFIFLQKDVSRLSIPRDCINHNCITAKTVMHLGIASINDQV